MGLYKQIDGWWGDDCHQFYADLVSGAKQPAHFVEVGSWMGRSAASMAESIRDQGKLIRFDCVDTWKGSEYGSHPAKVAAMETTLDQQFRFNLRRFGLWPYVNQVDASSVEAASTYEDESLDMVMLDADHRTEAVLADLDAWMPKLKPGGVICGHDATNEMVLLALQRRLNGCFGTKGMMWWHTKPNGSQGSYPDWLIGYPTHFPGVQNGWAWLLKGFRELGCQVKGSGVVTTLGYWSPPNRRDRGEPIHVALIEVDHPQHGTSKVWYDCSDFTESFPDEVKVFDTDLYFKKQCLTSDLQYGVMPIGQYLPDPDAYFNHVMLCRADRDSCRLGGNMEPKLPSLSDHYPISEGGQDWKLDGLARMSNIDERHNGGLRADLVARLKDRRGFSAGLWRWGANRPEPINPVGRLPYEKHLSEVAASKMTFALPGVGGDTTRNHTEIMGMGGCLITVKTEQEWPGNWRGCWIEMERDLGDLDEVINRALDDQERHRMERLSLWYFETNLQPRRMAERIIRECVKTLG
jgi:hypothetical protein